MPNKHSVEIELPNGFVVDEVKVGEWVPNPHRHSEMHAQVNLVARYSGLIKPPPEQIPYKRHTVVLGECSEDVAELLKRAMSESLFDPEFSLCGLYKEVQDNFAPPSIQISFVLPPGVKFKSCEVSNGSSSNEVSVTIPLEFLEEEVAK